MSEIDNGIKQPLRFYDSPDKQNWRRAWTKDGGFRDHHVLIAPQNAILPFQIRRRRSTAVITVFDLFSFNTAIEDFDFDMDLLSLIPFPTTNHFRIIQMETADNIVWSPQSDMLADIPCGLHYVHLSDGTNHWYSEVFSVIDGFTDNTINYVSTFGNATITGTYEVSRDGSDANRIISSSKPF